jgi:hypothetical protein
MLSVVAFAQKVPQNQAEVVGLIVFDPVPTKCCQLH